MKKWPPACLYSCVCLLLDNFSRSTWRHWVRVHDLWRHSGSPIRQRWQAPRHNRDDRKFFIQPCTTLYFLELV